MALILLLHLGPSASAGLRARAALRSRSAQRHEASDACSALIASSLACCVVVELQFGHQALALPGHCATTTACRLRHVPD
jgi:hypothetical protein